MKLLLCILLITLASNYTFSQWIWQNPNQRCNYISNMQFINSQTGYAAGYGGMILKTTNAGTKWESINSPSSDYIYNIHFISENTGWVLTDNGRKVYKSTNGGDDWDLMIETALNEPFIGFWFLTDLVGFGCTYQGIIKTTDGGNTWSQPITTASANDIYFVNENVGFAAVSGGILKTLNGGQTWQQYNIPGGPTGVTAYKVFALDAMNIYALADGIDFWGEYFEVFCSSSNGGVSWTTTLTDNNSDIYFESPLVGWSCSGNLLKTTDRGITWDTLDIKADLIEMKGNNSWVAYKNSISYSADKWVTATPQIKSIFDNFIWDGTAKDSMTVFACGAGSTILGTFDGGTTWRIYYSDSPAVYLNRIIFNNNNILAVGEGGVILRSTDNGLTWTKNYITANWLSDITFLDNNIGFAVGSAGLGVLYKTTNGGVTWNLHKLLDGISSVDHIKFSSTSKGWLTTNKNIMCSDDLGENWDTVYTAVAGDIDLSGDTAWISEYNFIKRTTDAGKTWEKFKIFDYGQMLFGNVRIKFVTPTIGFATVYDSRVFKTTDAGASWVDINSPKGVFPNAHTFVNERKGWIFGSWGEIIKYDLNLVGIKESAVTNLSDYFISANYPNPFNPETNILYSIPVRTNVIIKIFDITGREIKTLVNEEQEAGMHKISFDGSGLPSGVYFYRIKSGNFIKTNKMILIK